MNFLEQFYDCSVLVQIYFTYFGHLIDYEFVGRVHETRSITNSMIVFINLEHTHLTHT